MAHMAATYLGKMISNYLNGVHVRDIMHGVAWALETREMDTMLKAAEKLTPSTSKRKKHLPHTPTFISAIRQQLDLEAPLDVAIFACLTTCFYASARLGEFTVCTLVSFKPNKHVAIQNLSHDQDQNGLKVTVPHLPTTKAASIESEDVYWVSQDGDTDPMAALQNHLHINQQSEASYLFAYQAKHICHPLTKSKFLKRVANTVCATDLEPLQSK